MESLLACGNRQRKGSTAILCLALMLTTVELVHSSTTCKWSMVGQNYRGTVSVTRSGRTCQRWSNQYPHSHKFKSAAMLNEASFAQVENYCRNPDGEPQGPWCYTTDPDKRWEYCDIPLCGQCKWSDLGQDYQGTVSSTSSGKTCQSWISQSPHEHRFKSPWSFPDQSFEGAANYCRNPSGATGPWCYTTSADKRWQYCDIPLCKQCKTSVSGKEYQGKTSITVSGRKCQSWNRQHPHNHRFYNSIPFPDSSIRDVANYCRNPDGESGGPWCYTTDPLKRWEYCNVPLCSDCKRSNLGREYKGTRNVTWSGKTCQAWSSQSPHRHNNKTPEKFPDCTVADAANYCRNPDGEAGGPWCYTTDSSARWEYCDIPECWRQ